MPGRVPWFRSPWFYGLILAGTVLAAYRRFREDRGFSVDDPALVVAFVTVAAVLVLLVVFRRSTSIATSPEGFLAKFLGVSSYIPWADVAAFRVRGGPSGRVVVCILTAEARRRRERGRLHRWTWGVDPVLYPWCWEMTAEELAAALEAERSKHLPGTDPTRPFQT